ncbi:MAG: hypothetical protein OEX12_00205 [Gammaproteobacteria bacterium]|nr:hypothetical protein [Gammaproteobacteria bacterium]
MKQIKHTRELNKEELGPLYDYILGLNEQLPLDIELGLYIEMDQYLGGDLFIVDNVRDFRLIGAAGLVDSLDFLTEPNLATVPQAYDHAEYILEGAYAVLWVLCNNAGGPNFIIPRYFAQMEPNVHRSIRLTENSLAADVVPDKETEREVIVESHEEPSDEVIDSRKERAMDDGPDYEDGPEFEGYEERCDNDASDPFEGMSDRNEEDQKTDPEL